MNHFVPKDWDLRNILKKKNPSEFALSLLRQAFHKSSRHSRAICESASQPVFWHANQSTNQLNNQPLSESAIHCHSLSKGYKLQIVPS